MNLVLIGYRGTGKSTIGRVLAGRLGMSYIELDDRIVQKAGKEIPEIVAASGWDHFRDIESEVVREVSRLDGCLLDTGGGVILRPENVPELRRKGVVFWLRAEIPDIVERIQGGDQRPSLTGSRSFTEEVEEVLAERTPLYEAAADEVVDTSVLSEEEAVEHIARVFRERMGGKGGNP